MLVCRLRDAGLKAGKELDQYSTCLDYHRRGARELLGQRDWLTLAAHSNVFTKCRKEQVAFEAAYPVS